MSYKSRLENLERRLAGRNELIVVRIEGGLPDMPIAIASVGGASFTQDEDEAISTFEARMLGLAKATGTQIITFGGLPSEPASTF